ncbi:hypothetical protein SELMODRAFT_111112 [Selaginella moellendorffii]|uniref:Uncharacterized protein n=1 Tax=Selaginella moellendorffii TaxID=88036 RepID=D8S8H0_SELML|nr:uncharacterized protein LOC9634757 [Selaginella moellendorffii]EFJ19528.1 hypothetical protein SELMODRAFT_111112 [Selaginella moellendorffii]|eukprot:XP_002979639.1 uncharacterized protein LOC9634757 [Selaginella moellendorffii]
MELNYDPIFPDCPVVDHCLSIWSRQAAFHSKPAFVWIDESSEEEEPAVLTYGLLDSLAAATSSWLIHVEGLKRGDRVVLLYPPGLDFISVIFGCQRAGIAVIPLVPPSASSNKTKSGKDIMEVILEASPVAFISPKSLSAQLDGSSAKAIAAYFNLRWIALEPDKIHSVSLESVDDDSYVRLSRAEDLFLIQYTSGSTGAPKPVMISAGAAAHNARAARRAYDLQPSSIIVSWLPLYHDCGLMFILLTITCGATSFLSSPFSFSKRPWLWLEMLSKFKATCTVVPAFALPLVESKLVQDNSFPDPKARHLQLDLSHLESLILVNEPILAASVNSFLKSFSRFGLRKDSIAPSYGLAENSTFVCTAWKKSGDFPVYQDLLPSGKISSAHDDLQEMNLRVVDPGTSKEVPDGEEGEVWISSPSMGSGYVNDPALSSQTFQAKIHGSRAFFLRTGDTGVISHGFLFITGRIKDQLLLDGGRRKIHPQYLESTAFSFSPLLRPGCAVIFQARGENIVLIAETASGSIATPDAQAIASRIFVEILSKHEAPVWTIVLVSPRSIPKTTSGKLRRSEARRMYLSGELRWIKRVSFRELLSLEESFPPIELRSSL